MSLMLLGSVAFVFTLIYMLNSPDNDMRHYTWNVVSSAIQIFMAIILQDASTAIIKCYILPADAEPLLVNSLYFGLLLGWHTVLHFVLAVTCGVHCRKPKCPRSMALNLKCWAVTYGMASAGMGKLAWSTLQDLFQDNLMAAALLPLAAFGAFWGMFYCFTSLRRCVALSDDGLVDQYEQVWESYANRIEDSALAMAVALVLVKAQHFAMSGTLPLPNGDLRPGTVMPNQAVDLCLTSLVWVPIIVLVDLGVPARWTALKTRLTLTAGNCIAFGLINSATRWVQQECGSGTCGPLLSLPAALVVTAVGMLLIYGLDFLADIDCTGPRADANIRQMVIPISTLIGFGWKRAFGDAAKRVVAEVDILPDAVEHLILALTLIAWIMPAWRTYFLPVVMEQELDRVSEQFSCAAKDLEKEATESEQGSEQQNLLAATDTEKPGAMR